MNNNLHNQKRRNALLVDDEPAVLMILARVLEDEGFTVDRAESGEAAVELFETDYYSVVITDVHMEGISGFELIEHIAAVDSAVRTIIMTGYDSYEMVKKSLHSGAYDYLSKPLENHEGIKLCVRRAAEATQLVRDNSELIDHLRASHAMMENANQQLRVLNEELRVQANTDSLTEIYNRRFIDQALLHEVNRRNRYPDPLSVVMIDVDHFKKFNDTFGHEGGDKVLKFIAQSIKDSSRNIDVVGRYGGEEFLIILPKTSPDSALAYAERIRKTISEHSIALGSEVCNITISAGVSGVLANETNLDSSSLVNAADRALYRAKGSGRNSAMIERLVVGAELGVELGAEKRT